MELTGPLNHLPRVILAPEDLHGHFAELNKSVVQLRRVLMVIMTDLMLKEATLPNRTRNVVHKGFKRTGTDSVFVMDCREDPIAEMSPVLRHGPLKDT